MTNAFKNLSYSKLAIIALVVWQYICVAGMAILGWSHSLILLNLTLLAVFIIVMPVYESILLLILSIPFYVAVPNSRFDSLQMWRILFVLLFALWAVKDLRLKIKDLRFLLWDKYLAWFVGIGLLIALIFAPYKVEALKQILFWLNIYFLYVVLINTIKTKKQILELSGYAVWSLSIIVALGFTQLLGTFLTDMETFWVYWASNVAPLYYGPGFSNVALFSNSWFSYAGGVNLRMFSILPDSQSFAYICFICIVMGVALLAAAKTRLKKWIKTAVIFAGLGVILSGTRAVWVGMLLPFFVSLFAYFKNFQKGIVKKFLWPFAAIFILFILAPLINQGLSYLRLSAFNDDFLLRAESIYNLNETSNQGRIAMWKNSGQYFLTHPFGTGFGNFLVSFNPNSEDQSYDQLANTLNERYNLPAKNVSAHSLYLQVLVETGFIGFGIFALFWITVIKNFWNFLREHKDKEDFLVYFVAQALLMVLWVLAAAVFDITLFNDKVLMFFFINLGLAGLIVKNYESLQKNE